MISYAYHGIHGETPRELLAAYGARVQRLRLELSEATMFKIGSTQQMGANVRHVPTGRSGTLAETNTAKTAIRVKFAEGTEEVAVADLRIDLSGSTWALKGA